MVFAVNYKSIDTSLHAPRGAGLEMLHQPEFSCLHMHGTEWHFLRKESAWQTCLIQTTTLSHSFCLAGVQYPLPGGSPGFAEASLWCP